MARVTESNESHDDAITAQLNVVYAEEDSSLPPELEALSDEMLEMAFRPGLPE